jgi:hypothetical protein
MAQLVLTVAGSAFGPVGSMIGGFIGGMIDRSMAPDLPDQFGPRLEDLKVTGSAYGVNKPWHFGTTRTAGNLIYSQALEEVVTSVTTDADDGKGGGPSQTTITYTYFGTFAVSLGRGPAKGVRRMWANGVLVFDATLATSNPQAVALDFAFYPGNDTQLPDPTMEADLGVGMVPAYLDECYIVFLRVPLEAFGNRLPSFEFELTMGDGEWALADRAILGATRASPLWVNAVQTSDGHLITIAYDTGPNPDEVHLERIDMRTGEVVASLTQEGSASGAQSVYVPTTDEVWFPRAGLGAGYAQYNAKTLVLTGNSSADDALYSVGGAYYEPSQDAVISIQGVNLFLGGRYIKYRSDGIGLDNGGAVTLVQFLAGGGSVISMGVLNSGRFHIFNLAPGAVADVDIFNDAGAAFIVWDPTRRHYVCIGNSIWTVTDSLTPVITEYQSGTVPGANFGAVYMAGADAIAVCYSYITSAKVVAFDATTFDIVYDDFIGTFAEGYGGHAYAFLDGVFSFSGAGSGTLFGQNTANTWMADLYGTTYGRAVATLCKAGGELIDADIDVSDLGQRLRGYSVAQAGPARSAIEQLARADLFEGAEIDDVVTFVRRGGASVATITADECGAGLDNAQDTSITISRTQELDLPAVLTVTAADPYTDYQPGVQRAERLAHKAGEDQVETFAIVMNANEMKRLADARLFDRWASRESGTISVSRQHVLVTPTDIVTLDGSRVRILSRADEGDVIALEWVSDDADVIDQLSIGAQGAFVAQAIRPLVQSTLVVMDLALLRDADDHSGAYIAAYGSGSAWRGASIFRSPDDGDTYRNVATFLPPGSGAGEATNALATFSGGNVFDEKNTLTVSMYSGTPSSITRLAVLNGGNAAAVESSVGWEVIQYRDAVDNGDGTYTLTGLLRGRVGTDWAMGAHAIGDRVVLLSSTWVKDMPLDSSLLGLERQYKAVSVGASVADTVAQGETVDGERLECLSPVHLGGGRNAGADILLQWRRRTRRGGAWRDYVDASLGEASEAYALDIYTTSGRTVVARTISATSESATYTSAEQVADFGSNRTTLYWSVYQLSETVGRGHVANGTT